MLFSESDLPVVSKAEIRASYNFISESRGLGPYRRNSVNIITLKRTYCLIWVLYLLLQATPEAVRHRNQTKMIRIEGT